MVAGRQIRIVSGRRLTNRHPKSINQPSRVKVPIIAHWPGISRFRPAGGSEETNGEGDRAILETDAFHVGESGGAQEAHRVDGASKAHVCFSLKFRLGAFDHRGGRRNAPGLSGRLNVHCVSGDFVELTSQGGSPFGYPGDADNSRGWCG